MTAWWPQARAAILTFVVAGNLLYAVPFPRHEIKDSERETWRAPDLAMWHGWVTGLGLNMGQRAFSDRVIDGSNQLYHLGRMVHAPVRPFFRTLRTTQQWGLFGVVAEAPEAFTVEIERDGEWHVIEQRLHPEASWRDELFKYRRIRGTWDTIPGDDKPAPLYDALARWTARQAFADFPDVQRVRIYRLRTFTADPGEAPTREPKVANERVFERDHATLWLFR